jgi:mRNA-degrading endonuclease RelE of RelBE toxin-antitoxin system
MKLLKKQKSPKEKFRYIGYKDSTYGLRTGDMRVLCAVWRTDSFTVYIIEIGHKKSGIQKVTMKNNEYIKPQFLYDANNNPLEVYLSIEDYEAFMNKLERLSKQIEDQLKKQRKPCK